MSSTTFIPTQAHVRLTVRVLGAILLLFVGADHYYEYAVDQYSVLPTIGTLFLLNFISATALGLLLLAPLNRLFHRFAGAALEICARSRLRRRGDLARGVARKRANPAIRVHGVELPPGHPCGDRFRGRRCPLLRAAACPKPPSQAAREQPSREHPARSNAVKLTLGRRGS